MSTLAHNSAQSDQPAQPDWERLQWRALFVGIAGLVVCGATSIFNPEQFFRSYLVAFNYWLGISLGCLVILMIQYLTGGAWGIVLRRVLESATRVLVLLAALVVPIMLGLRYLYQWAQPEAVAEHQEILHEIAVLHLSFFSLPFFILRTVAYFAIWLFITFLLNRWSAEQDHRADPGRWRRFRMLSGPGLILCGLTITFASVDWVMSLEPHWTSTIFPLLFGTGQLLSAMAFAIFALVLLSSYPPLSEVIGPNHWRDLGNLLLTFVMFSAYMQVSQMILIWSGNLPEEIPWYLRRARGGWQAVAVILVLFYFALPFLLLLSKDIKRNRRTLAMVAGGLLVMRFVDTFWLIEPAFNHEGSYLFWLLDIAALIGIGGLWVAMFLWQIRQRPLLPLHDPDLKEALAHE